MGKNSVTPYPIHHAKKVFKALHKIWESGWSMIDNHPGNFIFTDKNELKIIDFEFSRRHDSSSSCFEQSWDIAGAPDSLLSEMAMAPNHTYRKSWLPAIGLGYHSLMNAPDNTKKQAYQYLHLLLFSSPRILSKKIWDKKFSSRQKKIRSENQWIYLPLNKKYR